MWYIYVKFLICWSKSFTINHDVILNIKIKLNFLDLVHEPLLFAHDVYNFKIYTWSLWISGNERDAANLQRLNDLGITHVLNVTSHIPLHFEKNGIKYKRIPASDSGQQNLRQYFEEAGVFIGKYYFLTISSPELTYLYFVGFFVNLASVRREE